MSESELTECESCTREIPAAASKCPECGARQPSRTAVLLALAIGAALFAVIAGAFPILGLVGLALCVILGAGVAIDAVLPDRGGDPDA